MNKKEKKFYLKIALSMGEMGLMIALPLLGFIFLGKHLDEKFNSMPLFIIIGIILSLGTSWIAVKKL